MMRVDILNRRMAEALGYAAGTSMPRFQWKFAPELPYWKTRLGRVWVICQWSRPVMPESEWRRVTANDIPYPPAMYQPLTENQFLSPPSEYLNQEVIRKMSEQMEKNFLDFLKDQQEETIRKEARDQADHMEESMNYAEKMEINTAYSPGPTTRIAGTRGDHVSFGGSA